MLKKKVLTILLILLFLLVVAVAVSAVHSRTWLIVREWTVSTPRISQEFTAVVIADLHGSSFGTQNEQLVEKIKEQQPDLILIAGDMLNEDAASDQEVCALVRSLTGIAPVYYGYGNHEMGFMEAKKKRKHSFPKDLQEAGATVLEKNYVDLTLGTDQVRIGGLYEYAFGHNGQDSAEAAPEEIKNFLQEFEDTDHFRIMISHRPDSFIFGNASSYWKVDLVISGHDHGGQVVLPLLGGVFGGDQGYFPAYVHGLYTKDNLQLFVTSGLGSQKEKIPRINNRPEIAVLHVTGEY